MPITLVTDGSDPLTAPAMHYLESLGIPSRLIRRIELISEKGEAQLIRATLFVDVDMTSAGEEVPS